jgi:FkbM family methyltransferase
VAKKVWGYKPSIRRQVVRLLCRLIIFVLRLNGRTIFSNEFIQMLDPKFKIKFENKDFTFRTGHGRLFWRAKTVLTEEPLMISWIKSMTPNDVVLDIGANVGMYSVLIASRVKTVYACELDSLNVAILRENLYLNHLLDKVKIIPLACGAKAEMVDVKFRSLSYGDALQLIDGGDETQTFGSNPDVTGYIAPVLQMSLDELFTKTELQRPNKIKIDVDGNELIVLAGTVELLTGASEIYFEDGMTAACATFMDFLLENSFKEVSQEKQFAKSDKNHLVGYTKIFSKTS